MDNNYLFKQGIVCQKHFETKFLTWTRTLSPYAVPTLHLPGFGAPRSVLTDVTNRMDIDQGIEHSQLSMPSTSTIGVLTEKVELQQNSVNKSKILSNNKLTGNFYFYHLQ
ncbi:hypothetical protein evm_007024 [Chilo suppressalis]|nr:hypothetical protein evm_007024 [Chilo suppressalis]